MSNPNPYPTSEKPPARKGFTQKQVSEILSVDSTGLPIQKNLWHMVYDERSYVTSPDWPAATPTYTK